MIHDREAEGLTDIEWYACEHPERPGDDFTIYDAECRGCFHKALADFARDGDCVLVSREDGTEVTMLEFLGIAQSLSQTSPTLSP